MEWAADIIWVLHIAFIAWFIIVPFTNNYPMLVLHLFTGPLLFLHWILNSDECSLTLIEMKLRGISECKESFFWNLVSPIYKPQSDKMTRQIVWILSLFLWGVTLSKAIRHPEIVTDVLHEAIATFKGQRARPQLGFS